MVSSISFRLWDDERELDAVVELEDDEVGRPTVVLQSAGGGNKKKGVGPRNPHYALALELLLQRLGTLGVAVSDALVDSTDLSTLGPDERRISLEKHPFPWALTASVDVHELRLEIGRAVATIGRPADARESSGNRQKRIRLWLSRRLTQRELAHPTP